MAAHGRAQESGDRAARDILLRGRVQGVGFRPFVRRLAERFGLSGRVRNLSGQVDIHAEGAPEALGAFERALLAEAPGLARPELVSSVDAACTGQDGFFIEESQTGGDVDVSVPPDVALCAACRQELWDPGDRRHRYPFVNCTQCGPRYSIIASLPYDRARTSMERFPLCADCAREYGEMEDRRYHAEPVACPACGPRVEYVRAASEGRMPLGAPSPQEPAVPARSGGPAAHTARTMTSEDPLRAVLRALSVGEIVAVQGVGGYHLLCDAASEAAVERLRERKRRPGKPLAVMVPRRGADGLDAVRELVEVSTETAAALDSEAHPIVLARRKPDAPVAVSVAPGLNDLGVMLPYSPLHEILLTDFGRPLVATSGNTSDEPLVATRWEAERELASVADAFLHHDRPILRSVDDSVLRDFGFGVVPLRLGRGLAPLEIALPEPVPVPLLAAGGQMKNTVALAWGRRVVMSPHLGDLEHPRTVDQFAATVASLRALFDVDPEWIVCDSHPDYASTRWALATGRPVVRVPHHRAHASALAGEREAEESLSGQDGARDARWLVFAWDGLGLGEDGTLWGGETFVGRPGEWRRVGSIRPFRILGAGRAGREAIRSARSLAWTLGRALDESDGTADGWPDAIRRADTKLSGLVDLDRHAWLRRLGTSETSAVGRLFDGAASLLLGRAHYAYEAQGPMELEAAAEGEGDVLPLPIVRGDDGIVRIDWEPLVSALLSARADLGLGGGTGDRSRFERGPSDERTTDRDAAVGAWAATIHATLADAAVRQAMEIRRDAPWDRIGVSGGVFQNRRLVEELRRRFGAVGFQIQVPRRIPMNDGGLAFGQVIEACSGGGERMPFHRAARGHVRPRHRL